MSLLTTPPQPLRPSGAPALRACSSPPPSTPLLTHPVPTLARLLLACSGSTQQGGQRHAPSTASFTSFNKRSRPPADYSHHRLSSSIGPTEKFPLHFPLLGNILPRCTDSSTCASFLLFTTSKLQPHFTLLIHTYSCFQRSTASVILFLFLMVQ